MERPSTELLCLPVAFSLPNGIELLTSASLADRERVCCRDSVSPDFFSPPLSYHIKKKLHSNSSTPCPAGSTLQSTTARIQFHTPAVEESTAQMSLSASTQILRFSHRRHNSGITASMYTPGPFWKTNRHTKSSKVRMSYRKILTQEALESAFTGPKYIWIHTSVVSEP